MRLKHGRKKGLMGVAVCDDMLPSFRQKLHDNKILLNNGMEALMSLWLENNNIIDEKEIDNKYNNYQKTTVCFSVTPFVGDYYRLVILTNNLKSYNVINELMYLYLQGKINIQPPEQNDYFVYFPDKTEKKVLKKAEKPKINLKNLYKKG